MSINNFKSRSGKLRNNLVNNFLNKKITEKDIQKIIAIVDEYEKANLSTIEKLKRDKILDAKRINGALKQTIHAHGAITKELIGSASKRIMGALLINEKKESFMVKLKKFFTKWIN